MRTTVIPADGAAPEQTAYVAVPVPTSASPGPWPGVVVVHEGPGPTQDMQEQCDWLAAAGYIAVMPDLFHGKSMVRCIKGVVRQLFAQSGPVFEQLEAARGWLARREDCTGSVGVIGFCLGGGFALLLAGRPGYDAAALNYSPLPKNLDEVLAGACPVVASFGGKDGTLKGAAAEVDLVLERAGVPHDVKEYPNARHAFFSRYVVPSPITTIAKIAGVGYDHDSTADAKRRILAWFDRYLRRRRPDPPANVTGDGRVRTVVPDRARFGPRRAAGPPGQAAVRTARVGRGFQCQGEDLADVGHRVHLELVEDLRGHVVEVGLVARRDEDRRDARRAGRPAASA